MRAKGEVFFPPFRLDLTNERLFRGERQLTLRPKNFAVLRYLVEHAGQLVRKEELGRAIWGAYPTEEALKQCIFRLRELLGDDAKSPQFIETTRGGYKFIAPLKNPLPPIPFIPALVGRDAELALLRDALEKARRGERQIVFITGEPGIGKTTLIDAFLAHLAEEPTVWIGRGQCIEHYGEGEAYLPILEALGRFSSRAGAEQFSAFLGRYAPTWLAQLPSLVDEDKQEALQRRVQGATKQHMLREIVEAVEIFTTGETGDEPPLLIFVLEDLQWSDYSTLDLLASAARRREPARVLVLGTYRPAEGLTEGHPLRAVTQELRGHGQCQELALEPLSADAVETYVEKRFPTSALPTRLSELLYRLTGGNPLFLATVVDDLMDRKVLVQADGRWMLREGLAAVAAGVPENIRQLVARQIERLNTKEQRILEAASVAGLEFSAAAVAAAADMDVVDVEACCDVLARRNQFLRPDGDSEWPDGTVSSCYGFRHALYQYLWQERLALTQRQRLHLRIGERQEAAYGARAGEIAAELAVHYEEGRNYHRALHYRAQAAENALKRYAGQEAIVHLTKGLETLGSLPEAPGRTQQELHLRSTLGIALQTNQGYGNPAVAQAYARARELSQKVQDPAQLFLVLFGLYLFHLARGEHTTAGELTEQMVSLAQSTPDPVLHVAADSPRGVNSFFRGAFITARTQLDYSSSLYDPQQHRVYTVTYGQDPWVACQAFLAEVLWLLGYPQQALETANNSLAMAESLAHPFSLAAALYSSTMVAQFRRDGASAHRYAQATLTLANEKNFPVWAAGATILLGGSLVMQGGLEEGIAQIQQGLATRQTIGTEMRGPYHKARLAEAYGQTTREEEGLTLLEEGLALATHSGERWWEAELYRLQGELTLRSPNAQGLRSRPSKAAEKKAEEYFQQALSTAQRQSAKSLELRAAMSLSRLWKKQGKNAVAKEMLAQVYSWFAEGLDTPDLQEAQALLTTFR